MEGSLARHVVDGGQDRSRHGADRFLRTASGFEAEELRFVVADFGSLSRPSTLDGGRCQPWGVPEGRRGDQSRGRRPRMSLREPFGGFRAFGFQASLSKNVRFGSLYAPTPGEYGLDGAATRKPVMQSDQAMGLMMRLWAKLFGRKTIGAPKSKPSLRSTFRAPRVAYIADCE